MSIKLETLQEICNRATAQAQVLYPNLKMMFIPHESGHFHEVVLANEHELRNHPAGAIAKTILEKNSNREQSSLLGMAIHNEVKWLGLSSQDHILALFNINTDEFGDKVSEATRTIYHLIWHAMDLVEIRQRPEYQSKFRVGPMIPKRSPMNLSHLNLQADVFAAVMSGLQGEEKSIDTLAHRRAVDSVSRVHARRAEDYPFVIAMEAAHYAYGELLALKPPPEKYMQYARQLATAVGDTFDDKSIRQWWAFSEPSQDMAWRLTPADFILGCAVASSNDPFVRATGHLVSDVTGITPSQNLMANTAYNAYANQEQNQLLHRELVEKAFKGAMERGVREESSRPLSAAANEQNENLAEGIILGWCANALQSAARAFENALSNGVSPTQAARLEFEGTKEDTNWEALKKIGGKIIEQKRKGFDVTLGNVAEICAESPGLEPVLGAIKITMKDPGYIQKIQLANGLGMRGPSAQPVFAPVSAAPKVQGPAPTGPQFSPPTPGLGGGSGGNAAARQRAIMEKIRREKTDGDRTQ